MGDKEHIEGATFSSGSVPVSFGASVGSGLYLSGEYTVSSRLAPALEYG